MITVNTDESNDPTHIMLISATTSQLKYERLETEKRCSLPSV